MEENIVTVDYMSDDLAGKYLTFYIADNVYGVELMHVIEIISIQSITRVPNVPNYVKGIINLRGKIAPVIDIRLKFKLEERAYDERTCIIVVSIDNAQVGLIVDSVSEVTVIDSANLSAVTEINRINNNKFLKSIGRIGSKLILNIDCEKIFHDSSDVHF